MELSESKTDSFDSVAARGLITATCQRTTPLFSGFAIDNQLSTLNFCNGNLTPSYSREAEN
jgi:hypothetical protein